MTRRPTPPRVVEPAREGLLHRVAVVTAERPRQQAEKDAEDAHRSGFLGEQFPFAGGANQAVEPASLGSGGAAALRREGEVLAPGVDVAGAVDRGDQPVGGEPAKRLVERSGRRIEPAAGSIFDVLADGVAVGGTVPSASRT